MSPSSPPRRLARSLKQEYEEFILQRIEEYKESLSREEILKLGDDAVRELEVNTADQYLLTEVLLLEHVDRIIKRRLRLPTFRRWQQRFKALRSAQREPTHWGLEQPSPLPDLARRLQPGDLALVVGAHADGAALFLAAHDVDVVLIDQDLTAVELAESRAVTEQLADRLHALVVRFGGWLPDVSPTLIVFDSAALAPLSAQRRIALVRELQRRTRPTGIHYVIPPVATHAAGPGDVIPLAPDALQSYYKAWIVDRIGPRVRRGAVGGFMATKPARHGDTASAASE
ncbi:MAG: hypothetical protein ACREN5_05415 [Gemmatimonadales bacterium]